MNKNTLFLLSGFAFVAWLLTRKDGGQGPFIPLTPSSLQNAEIERLNAERVLLGVEARTREGVAASQIAINEAEALRLETVSERLSKATPDFIFAPSQGGFTVSSGSGGFSLQ